MVQSDRLIIGPSLGDIDRGIKSGAPKRVLYKDLSEIADKSRDDNSPIGEAVKKGLDQKAVEIHEQGK